MGPTGCLIDPVVAEQFCASLPYQSLMAAAPMFADQPMTDFFLFDYEAEYLKSLKALGVDAPWPTYQSGQTIYLLPHHQLTNDCTSHGLAGAMEDREFVRIIAKGENSEFKLIASEPLYGGAITEIMRTRGDNGAYTNAPIKYAIQFGFLARAKYGNIDLTVYDAKKANAYSINGVPSALKEFYKLKMQTAVPVRTYEEGSPFIQQGYSIVGGSNQGFSSVRDANGFCKPQGSWAHCTRFRGKRVGNKPGWAYGQSWGKGMPAGPLTVKLDSGRELDLPEGTFFVDPDTINKMIRQGEFYAVSDFDGFTMIDNKLY